MALNTIGSLTRTTRKFLEDRPANRLCDVAENGFQLLVHDYQLPTFGSVFYLKQFTNPATKILYQVRASNGLVSKPLIQLHWDVITEKAKPGVRNEGQLAFRPSLNIDR